MKTPWSSTRFVACLALILVAMLTASSAWASAQRPGVKEAFDRMNVGTADSNPQVRSLPENVNA